MPGEEKELFEPFSALADGLLVFLMVWISALFWKPYRHFKEKRNLYMSVAFLTLAAFKLVQFVADKLLGIEALEWMDSNLASEVQIILLSGAIIWVLMGQARSTAAVREDRKRAA